MKPSTPKRLLDALAACREVITPRNRIIHGYDTVNDEIIWDIVRTKLPGLERQLAQLLAAYEREMEDRS